MEVFILKHYNIYLKSHTEAHDLEDEVKANSFDEAVDYFYSKLSKYGWDRITIADNTQDMEALQNDMIWNEAGGN